MHCCSCSSTSLRHHYPPPTSTNLPFCPQATTICPFGVSFCPFLALHNDSPSRLLAKTPIPNAGRVATQSLATSTSSIASTTSSLPLYIPSQDNISVPSLPPLPSTHKLTSSHQANPHVKAPRCKQKCWLHAPVFTLGRA